MPNRKTTAPFQGTAAQEKDLRALIAKEKDKPGFIMPILQGAQDIYGYLPEEVLQIISEETKVSTSELYGVLSFYSQFATDPKGKYQIQVCMGTACYVKNAQALLDRCERVFGCKPNGAVSDDGLYSLEGVRCVGACGLAPLIIVNGDVYGRISDENVDDIFKTLEEKYK